MTNNDFQKRVQHFATLKTKYQASDYEDSSPSSPLYFILRKADLGIELTEFELNWLKEQKLHQTSQFISQKRVLSSGELLRQGNTREFQQMRVEFSNLKSKYEATHYILRWQTSPLYFILCKLDSGYPLTDSEMKYLQDNHLDNIVMLVTNIRQFVTLKVKHQATQYRDSFSVSLLYSILKRLEEKERLSDEEVNWLKSHELFEILAIFQQQESVRKAEFSKLKAKYQATTYPESHVSNPLYQILQNFDTGKPLTESELQWLKEQELVETFELVQELEQQRHFAELKKKYKATQYEDSSPSSHLYPVLKQIDSGKPLSESNLNFLRKRQLMRTCALAVDKYVTSLKSKVKSGNPLSEAEIDWLKNYGHEDIIIAHLKSQLELRNQLNPVEIDLLTHNRRENLIIAHLQSKLELGNQLNSAEINWLKQNGREDIMTLAQVASLKSQVESGHPLSKTEINWLKQNGREDIITFAIDTYAARLMSKAKSGNSFNEAEIDWLTKNGREDIILAQLKSHAKSGRKKLTLTEINWLKNNGGDDILIAHFKSKVESGNQLTQTEINWLKHLKSKYGVSDYQDDSPSNQLYAILQQLEKGKRLEATDIVWLTEKSLFYSGNKVFTTYHQIEATFYEQEYKRTGNKWNLPSASSHWRSAQKPEHALALTDNLNFDKIKENKLKSALLTTRGGAFRDMGELGKAEQCARQAMKYQPNSHHPYTLMGAICYDRSDFSEGDNWFKEAIKRGASPRDVDAEIKRVFKNADNNKRLEILAYLQNTNHRLYKWAKSMLKQATLAYGATHPK